MESIFYFWFYIFYFKLIFIYLYCKNHYKYYTQLKYQGKRLIQLYGFTQNPNTLDYMIVMKYAIDGSLRKNLQNIVKYNWITKLRKLKEIISGLSTIHQQKLIHCDFHHGNILNQSYGLSISDLGLCKPMEYYQSTSKKNDIYGVLPFVAPEVLRGKPYTLASDIYSFSMIMWEFTSGIPPFDDNAHDFHLALNICKGKRPEIVENTPQCYMDLMKKCWDKDPLKRPDASEIADTVNNWISIIIDENINEKSRNIIIEFYKADKFLEQKQTDTSNVINNKSHSQAYHTSRLLDFTKKLNEILDQEDMEIYGYENNKNDKSHETEISQSIGNYL